MHLTRIVQDAAGDAPVEPLFLYLAYHNVHDACTKEKALNAPLETVEMYGTTKLDTWKLQGISYDHIRVLHMVIKVHHPW